MKAPTGKLAFAYRTIAALEDERDALAQRCAELEADLTEQADLLKEAIEQRDSLDRLQIDECFRREKTEVERDTLRAEVERLRTELNLTEDSLGHALDARDDAIDMLRQIAAAAGSKSITAFLVDIYDLLGTRP